MKISQKDPELFSEHDIRTKTYSGIKFNKSEGRIRVFFPAHHLIVLNISPKFRENISNVSRAIEQP